MCIKEESAPLKIDLIALDFRVVADSLSRWFEYKALQNRRMNIFNWFFFYGLDIIVTLIVKSFCMRHMKFRVRLTSLKDDHALITQMNKISNIIY